MVDLIVFSYQHFQNKEKKIFHQIDSLLRIWGLIK